MKKNIGRLLIILKTTVVFGLAIMLGWLIPKAMTSLELHRYYNNIDVVSSNDIFVGRFSVTEGVDAADLIDILNDKPYVVGYANANTITAAKAEFGRKTVDSALIFKTGKWCGKNTYKIVEGNDLPDTFEGRVPILVSENQWKKASVGDNVDLTVPTANGDSETVEAYIIGKISNTAPIAGVNFYFTEPFAGEIIIPDIGADKYIKNSSRSYAVMIKMSEGKLTDLITAVDGVARVQIQNERNVNYLTVGEQQSKTEYLIYIAVALSIALAAAAFFIDKDRRVLNCLIAAATTIIFVSIFTAAQFSKDIVYEIESAEIFTKNAALYLQSAIVPDVIYLASADAIMLCVLGLTAFILKKKKKAKTEQIEATVKLYD